MMTEASQNRYSKGAMAFHWVIAIAIIVNWRLVEMAEHAEKADASWYMGQHKAIGITILLLSLGRLAWRITHKAPPLPATYATWERLLARAAHSLFYILMIGLPIGGWLGSSYFGKGVDMFGLFYLPALPVGENHELGKSIFGFHHTGGEVMLYVIVLHILGALKHTFFDKDGGIFRMLPFGKVS